MHRIAVKSHNVFLALATFGNVGNWGCPNSPAAGDEGGVPVLLDAPWRTRFSGRAAARRVDESGLEDGPASYIFNRQTTPTSSQYHSVPCQMLIPCGNGSESDS